jgi:hypothetical protein
MIQVSTGCLKWNGITVPAWYINAAPVTRTRPLGPTVCNTTVQCVVWNGAPPSTNVPGTGFVNVDYISGRVTWLYKSRAVRGKFAFKRGSVLREARATAPMKNCIGRCNRMPQAVSS